MTAADREERLPVTPEGPVYGHVLRLRGVVAGRGRREGMGIAWQDRLVADLRKGEAGAFSNHMRNAPRVANAEAPPTQEMP